MDEHARVEAAVEAARRHFVLFESDARGWLEVSGGDRVRWLDGMITADVAALDSGPEGAGCPALLLTNRGAIIADFHVGRIGDRFVLETRRSEIPKIAAALERFIIADDVRLEDRSDAFITLGLEGPGAGAVLEAALAADGDGEGPCVLPEADAWSTASLAGQSVLIGAFGWSGESAYQLRVPVEARLAVIGAIEDAAGGPVLLGTPEALDILRVEAGLPVLGRELSEDVLPPEARLERSICATKGCYVGQEIVARLRARGQVNHLLVGVSIDADALPVEGTELSVGDKRTGELTSVVRSPSLGPIALAFVRREHAEPGTSLSFAGGTGCVVSLPFVASRAEPA